MKNNRNIVIDVVCVAVSLACVILTFYGQIRYNGVFTLDAYISVIATLIAICTTLMVGLQIYNHMQIREVTESVKNIRKLENEQKSIIKKLRFAQKGVSDLFRLEGRRQTDDYIPICLAISVIAMYEDGVTDKEVLKDILEKYKKLWNYCDRNVFNYRMMIKYLPDFQKMHFESSTDTSKKILQYHVRFLNKLYEEAKK
ncbi:MAG: hypothetical protein IJ190_05770 [Prevotella sp.]|nr:hypothetical protein [Prevotella sp.]